VITSVLSINALHNLYQDYNRRFFNAELSKVKIEWSDNLTRKAGLFSPTEPLIRLSAPLLSDRIQDLKDTLIHEMIHVAQFVHQIDERPHGPYFSAYMARINEKAKGEVTVSVTHHILQLEDYEESSMLGKIKKLLALSDSPNENEAYAAAQKVQTLMAAHGVEYADLKTVEEGSELDEPLVNEVIEDFGARTVGWKFSLLGAICRVNYCSCLGGGQYGIRALGNKTHVEICRSYYQYFVHVIESEAAQYRGQGRVFLNRFREAMVHEIGKRLQQQFQQNNPVKIPNATTTSTLSLASQYQAELDLFVQWVYPRVNARRASARWADAKATQAGRQAGAQAHIAKHIVPETRRLKGDR
jgi:predicted SprT family Zn-dependent metalloprotease